MTELKRCPFCGSPAELLHTKTWDYFVRCTDKGCAARTRQYHENSVGAVNAWNKRAATTIGQVAVEVVPTKLTCKLEPLKAFEVTVNMLDQTEWGVCANCGTASPIDATYCCECGARVVDA